ncbi:MAG: ATP-binding protein [Butyrivibrio sp.]|nr:ATP-binding protein [Muribaculum sp.]MCM1552982.1 ATP-binding protein [Butyrivibrio sp.]
MDTEKLLPDYNNYRKIFDITANLIYLALVAFELVFYKIMEHLNLLTLPVREYIIYYILLPVVLLAVTLVLQELCVRSERIPEPVKNVSPIITIVCMFGALSIIHRGVGGIIHLVCIPIAMTVVFCSYKVCAAIIALSELWIGILALSCFISPVTSDGDEYLVPELIIAAATVAVCGAVAIILVTLLNQQNSKLLVATLTAQDAEQRAQEASKAKSAFLSNMSHEIRTPMNAIIGMTDVMLRSERSPEDTKYLMNIKNSGDALLAIINDILDFSKIESGKLEIIEEEYETAAMFSDLSVIFKTRIGDKKVELLFDIDENLPKALYGDALRIRQIIINLMNNATKFTEEGYVKLTIKVQEIKDKDIELYFSVQDSGQGIREDDLAKLFHSFEQVNTKKNHSKEGTGLGLAISKQLVELMGGSIGVTSEYGKGSEFYFTIHQEVRDFAKTDLTLDYEQMQQASRKQEQEFMNFTAPDALVLMAEDNEINAEVAIALMEPLGMQIELAENGQTALDKIREKHYDLVFMDHMMPVKDGVEATRELREMEGDYYHKLPVIALSANALVDSQKEFAEAGMNDFLAKPISMKEVCRVLRKWLPEEKLHEMK